MADGEQGGQAARKPTRVYENDGIRVLWDAPRCIHSGRCIRAEPGVFNTKARPWVNLDGATPEAIAAAIRACPSGALRYEAKAGLPAETPDDPPTVEVKPNGPLYLRGRFRLEGPGCELADDEFRVALCRCGASANKPFCDNSHRRIGFHDDPPTA